MNSEDNRIIILCGQRGIGKSTVCRRITTVMRGNGVRCGGIITYKSGDSAIIIEDVETEKSIILASVHPEYNGPRIGQYFFNPEGLEFGLTALKNGSSRDLFFIDELGHLETRGKGFAIAFDYLERPAFKHAIIVIREELLSTLLTRFRNQPRIIQVTQESRNSLAEYVVSLVSHPISHNQV